MQISKILKVAEEQRNETSAEELHIVGLTSIIVDCDLEYTDWHGVNIVVVADRLVVHNDICFDVSGMDVKEKFEKAADGHGSGSDGHPGIYY